MQGGAGNRRNMISVVEFHGRGEEWLPRPPPPHTHTHFLNKVMFLKSCPGKLLKAERLTDIFVLSDEDKIIQVTEGVAPR